MHYENIYELLEETIENLNKQFLSSFDNRPPLEMKSKKDAFLITDEQLIPYLNFVKQNKRVLRLIKMKPQLFQAQKTYQRMYDKIFYPAISQFISEENEKIYNLEFFTAGISAIVHKWLELDCITDIKDLVDIIKKCIGYSIE